MRVKYPDFQLLSRALQLDILSAKHLVTVHLQDIEWGFPVGTCDWAILLLKEGPILI